jgi:hypothetical protein
MTLRYTGISGICGASGTRTRADLTFLAFLAGGNAGHS